MPSRFGAPSKIFSANLALSTGSVPRGTFRKIGGLAPSDRIEANQAPMTSQSKKCLLGFDGNELDALIDEVHEPSYRSEQMFEALYRQRVESLEQISTLPANLR